MRKRGRRGLKGWGGRGEGAVRKEEMGRRGKEEVVRGEMGEERRRE